MGEFILTVSFLVINLFLLVAVYVLPIVGVATGCVLLKKKMGKKVWSLTVLLGSSAICIAVALWKIVNF